jgi:hypothetical protein
VLLERTGGGALDHSVRGRAMLTFVLFVRNRFGCRQHAASALATGLPTAPNLNKFVTMRLHRTNSHGSHAQLLNRSPHCTFPFTLCRRQRLRRVHWGRHLRSKWAAVAASRRDLCPRKCQAWRCEPLSPDARVLRPSPFIRCFLDSIRLV